MTEVLIIGGGPAGAAAGRLLALWGHTVTLVTRPTPPGPTFGVSIPPSTDKLFSVLGLEPWLERAGAIRSTGHTVWWRAGEARVETFAGGALGWQVPLDRLASTMSDGAREAGVRVELARANDLDSVRRAWPSKLVIDCSGRSGLVPRARGWRVFEPDLRTVALTGVWRRNGWSVPDESHTLIEAYEDGWCWSIPSGSYQLAVASSKSGPGARYVAVMVDPRRSSLQGDGAREVYLSEIAKTTRFAALLEGAELEEGPSGWDASMYSSTRYAEGDVLVAGDAGSFIDPLSSTGVKKALASAWLAAVAAHTALETPAMQGAAFDFFEAREREVYQEFRAQTVEMLAEAAEGRESGFWSRGSLAGGSHAVPSRDSVAAAWEQIQAADRFCYRRAAGVRVEERAAVEGHRIVLQPRIVSDEADPGVRFIREVDMVALIDMAGDVDDVGALFEAYLRRAAPVALPDFLAALATAVARGWLVCYK